MNGIGSNIPKARSIVKLAIMQLDGLPALPRKVIGRTLRNALGLMTRKKCTRRIARKHVEITPAMRRQIFKLARTSQYSLAEIAIKVGLGPRGQGRVSEILDNLR